jgi:hypothetical protein
MTVREVPIHLDESTSLKNLKKRLTKRSLYYLRQLFGETLSDYRVGDDVDITIRQVPQPMVYGQFSPVQSEKLVEALEEVYDVAIPGEWVHRMTLPELLKEVKTMAHPK